VQGQQVEQGAELDVQELVDEGQGEQHRVAGEGGGDGAESPAGR